MFAVVGKHPWVGFWEAGAATGARALDRKVLLFKLSIEIRSKVAEWPDHAHDPLSMLECAMHGFAQRCFMLGTDGEVSHRQLDRVLFEPIQTRPPSGGDEGLIDAQMGIPFAGGPFCQVGVEAFASRDERR